MATMILIATVCSPALRPVRSRVACTASSRVVNISQTEWGARRESSVVGGIGLGSTSEGSWPTTSMGMALGYVLTSLGSAALTAETQTEMPRTRARRKVRMFLASIRMFILFVPAEEIREKPLQPDALRRDGFGAEECDQDILESLGIDAADHPACMRNGNGTALFRDDHGDRVADLRDAQRRAMAQTHLALG